MFIRNLLTIFILIIIGFLETNAGIFAETTAISDDTLKVTSPDGKNAVEFLLVDGKPMYKVSHSNQIVIKPSLMGFTFKKENNSLGRLQRVSADSSSTDETWQQVWGEKQDIRNHFNQLSIVLQEENEPQRNLEIEFRAFDDGIAFRYVYPQQGDSTLVIMDELTEFNLADDGQAWWIGAYQDNRYEFLYTKSAVSELDTVHTPLTIQSDSGLYLSIHEARLVDFASMTLKHTDSSHLKADLVPWADGDRVKTDGSFISPWRTLQIAQEPGDLITSYMILNLNDENALSDISWIQPHKYLGIWWGMHIGKYTFYEGPKHGASTENSIKYIDYCSQLGIDHLLIEGWNKGWTPEWYLDDMHMFSFTESTDDFDLKTVTDYANEKGVKIIGYHETGSNLINYLEQIDAGMSLYQSMGINDIKIGQVGSRLNMKEWHHGQFGVRYYRYILEKTADYNLTVNFHEPIKDTGERRTYPHMMTREGVRGQEYNAWSEGNPPSHTAILPFTRMLSGPMDFTPGVLDVSISQGYGWAAVHTTAAKQLALYVVLYSPVQMLADLPENYVDHPAMKFLQDVPVDWQDTQVLNAAIGEYVTIVRKDRNSDDWYLGSLTNEDARTFDIDLSFLDPNQTYQAQIYEDADRISWSNNAHRVAVAHKFVTSNDTLELNLAKGGGTAIRFTTSFTAVLDNENSMQPQKLRLDQNYPNPFNPSTTIEYYLPVAADVTLKVYNIAGQQIGRLVDEFQPSGKYKITWTPQGLSSGLYITKLQAGEHSQSRKLILYK